MIIKINTLGEKFLDVSNKYFIEDKGLFIHIIYKYKNGNFKTIYSKSSKSSSCCRLYTGNGMMKSFSVKQLIKTLRENKEGVK